MPKIKVQVITPAEIREGRALRIDVAGRPLLLSRKGGYFFAIDAICSHAGGRLEDGEILNGCVTCPIHGAIFDLATGKASPQTDWAADLEAFPVAIEHDALLVEINVREAPGVENAGNGVCPWSGADQGIDFDPTKLEQTKYPFDLYARARREMPIFYSERFDLWVVTRYQDIVAILKDVGRFSSAQSLAVDNRVAPEVQAVLDTGYPATPTMVTADRPSIHDFANW
jgi:nitrite reductase/ring-hydroxylating ferredoxin subunit